MLFEGKNSRPRYQCLFDELPSNVFKYTTNSLFITYFLFQHKELEQKKQKKLI